jgi:hypothetical protein
MRELPILATIKTAVGRAGELVVRGHKSLN